MQFKINPRNSYQNINQNNQLENTNKILVKINDLNEKVKRLPFILGKNEKLMSVIFQSSNQRVNYSLVCKNTDTINKLEKELYKEFPNLFQKDLYYLSNGNNLDKYGSLEKNHIKNGDVILIIQNDSLSSSLKNK